MSLMQKLDMYITPKIQLCLAATFSYHASDNFIFPRLRTRTINVYCNTMPNRPITVLWTRLYFILFNTVRMRGESCSMKIMQFVKKKAAFLGTWSQNAQIVGEVLSIMPDEAIFFCLKTYFKSGLWTDLLIDGKQNFVRTLILTAKSFVH